MPLANALADVEARIRSAETRFGRPRNSVSLLAVSKTKPLPAIEEAIAAGQRLFGENHLQDASPKIEALAGRGLEWHYIGPIQSNKTRPIATLFDWTHSIDRLKVAHRLSEQRPAGRAPLNVCIQVNTSGEETKSGVTLADVDALARQVAELPGLMLRGLMTIPRPETDFEAQRRAFAPLREKLQALNQSGMNLDTLSMGMTDDMEAAIAEGATIVRIGTAIFGARER